MAPVAEISAPRSAEDTESVRIATIRAAGAGSLPVWVAAEEAFFKRWGVDIEVVEFSGAGLSTQALLMGGVHVAAAAPQLVFAIAASRGQYLKLVHVTANNVPPVAQLIVSPAADVNGVEDLQGKKVALDEMSGGCLACASFVHRLGQLGFVANKDFQVARTAHQRMGEALASGIIDAGVMIQPYNTLAIQDKIGFPLEDPRLGERGDAATQLFGTPIRLPGYDRDAGAWLSTTAVWTTEDYLTRNPEEVHSVAKAIADACDWLREPAHAEKAAQVLITHTVGTSESGSFLPTAQALLGTTVWKSYPDGFSDWKALDQQMEVMATLGILTHPVEVKRCVSLPWYLPT